MEPHSIYHYWRAMAGMAFGRGGSAPTVLELGANDGADAVRLAKRSVAPIHWIGLEPDPRNFPRLRELIATYRHLFASTAAYQLAASNVYAVADLYLSGGETPGCGGECTRTAPASTCQPSTWRLIRGAPSIKPQECERRRSTTSLPGSAISAWPSAAGTGLAAPVDALGLALANDIDLMWVDVQGAQRKVLEGARNTLNKTRFLDIECHPEPLYEDEPTPQELVEMLPGWEVIAQWPTDVLLLNTWFSATPSSSTAIETAAR